MPFSHSCIRVAVGMALALSVMPMALADTCEDIILELHTELFLDLGMHNFTIPAGNIAAASPLVNQTNTELAQNGCPQTMVLDLQTGALTTQNDLSELEDLLTPDGVIDGYNEALPEICNGEGAAAQTEEEVLSGILCDDLKATASNLRRQAARATGLVRELLIEDLRKVEKEIFELDNCNLIDLRGRSTNCGTMNYDLRQLCKELENEQQTENQPLVVSLLQKNIAKLEQKFIESEICFALPKPPSAEETETQNEIDNAPQSQISLLLTPIFTGYFLAEKDLGEGETFDADTLIGTPDEGNYNLPDGLANVLQAGGQTATQASFLANIATEELDNASYNLTPTQLANAVAGVLDDLNTNLGLNAGGVPENITNAIDSAIAGLNQPNSIDVFTAVYDAVFSETSDEELAKSFAARAAQEFTAGTPPSEIAENIAGQMQEEYNGWAFGLGLAGMLGDWTVDFLQDQGIDDYDVLQSLLSEWERYDNEVVNTDDPYYWLRDNYFSGFALLDENGQIIGLDFGKIDPDCMNSDNFIEELETEKTKYFGDISDDDYRILLSGGKFNLEIDIRNLELTIEDLEKINLNLNAEIALLEFDLGLDSATDTLINEEIEQLEKIIDFNADVIEIKNDKLNNLQTNNAGELVQFAEWRSKVPAFNKARYNLLSKCTYGIPPTIGGTNILPGLSDRYGGDGSGAIRYMRNQFLPGVANFLLVTLYTGLTFIIVSAGVMQISSTFAPDIAVKARKTITWAIIGTILATLAFGIVKLIIGINFN